ncbi:hypothetical protein HDU86_001196 [Geranomyces michiganensis]|nr:hypothetical protein HDU86_001196 [Geranomyces michiganensis]
MLLSRPPFPTAVSLAAIVLTTAPALFVAAQQQPQQPLSDAAATTAIASLCAQMSGMVGCSINTACASAGAIPDPYCKPVSILGDICANDMPTMSGCSGYTSACGNSTTTSLTCAAPIPSLITSKTATQGIRSICSEMNMAGCEAACAAKIMAGSSASSYAECDLLGTYAALCKSMPGMSQCAEWKTMCAATPDLTYCRADASVDAPEMKMFFHTGFTDYVLFQNWVPRTALQYFGTWLAIFVFAIAYEGWNAALITAEARLLAATAPKTKKIGSFSPTDKLSPPTTTITPPWHHTALARLQRAALRFVSKAVTVTAAYLLMLVAMTFNVGLFFAVVVGLGVGSALFSEWSRAAVTAAVLNEAEELCC